MFSSFIFFFFCTSILNRHLLGHKVPKKICSITFGIQLIVGSPFIWFAFKSLIYKEEYLLLHQLSVGLVNRKKALVLLENFFKHISEIKSDFMQNVGIVYSGCFYYKKKKWNMQNFSLCIVCFLPVYIEVFQAGIYHLHSILLFQDSAHSPLCVSQALLLMVEAGPVPRFFEPQVRLTTGIIEEMKEKREK